MIIIMMMIVIYPDHDPDHKMQEEHQKYRISVSWSLK